MRVQNNGKNRGNGVNKYMAFQVSIDDVRKRLPVRRADANKGSHGRVLVIGGSSNFIGAAALAGIAAYRVGAGLVTLCVPDDIKPIVAGMCPEATFLHFEAAECHALDNVKAVVLGPGMSQSDSARKLLTEYMREPLQTPHVLDADALNMLAPMDAPQLPNGTVLTPHLGEMSRLTGQSLSELQANRLLHATYYAQMWGCILVLKGAETIIAAPSTTPAILPFANPALAVAGTGDVLSGCIGGLLAQGLAPIDAAICGAYVHGSAGQMWSDQYGDAGLLASDILMLLPTVLKLIKTSMITSETRGLLR